MIRPAAESDLPAIERLAEEWSRSGETLGFEASEEVFLRAALGHCFFLAEEEQRVVGYLWGERRNDPRYRAVVPENEPYLLLQELYVVPERRSRGLGTQLLEQSKIWAVSNGIGYVVGFTATRPLERVLAFYRRCGLEAWSAQLVMNLQEAREKARAAELGR